MTRWPRALAIVAVAALAGGSAAAEPSEPKRDWRQEKCFRFARDWEEALRRFGQDGLSAEFVAGGSAFIHAHCVAAGTMCPTTAKDRKLADVLAIRVVNEGMSTTFLPFACRDSRASP